MNTKTVNAAQKVLNIFPNMHELMHSPEMKMLAQRGIINPFAYIGFKNDLEWEGVSIAVQGMCVFFQNRNFDDGYCFPGGSEKGEAMVYPAYGEPIKIDSLTVYKALLVIMFCSWMEIGVFSNSEDWHNKNKELAEKQNAARINFLNSCMEVYKILD